MSKGGLDKLANLVAAGAGGAGAGGEEGETDPEMQAVLKFIEDRGHGIFEAQELLLACAMELNLQMREDEDE
jgi:hypothetical protein